MPASPLESAVLVGLPLPGGARRRRAAGRPPHPGWPPGGGPDDDPLLRLCYLGTLDVDAAADAAQEALARAWGRWETLEHQEPAAWVRTVALNLCRSRWRRLRRELGPRRRDEPAAEMRVSDPDLLAALRRLSERQREAVVLRYWADLPVDACARTMGTSVGTVKQHLSRARAALGRQLALEGELA